VDNANVDNAREEILARVRAAVAGSPTSEYSSVPRTYRAADALETHARIHLFTDRLLDYGAGVYTCSETEIARTVERAVIARKKQRLLVPAGLSDAWLPRGLGFCIDENLSYDELDHSQGVLTGCALAIAATGTIVLRHSPEEGRRALTLIPDYHLCVVFAGQIVETVVQGLAAMTRFSHSPITTISGPSATADIEMTRIKGVHGPRVLDVIIVSSAG
jgi:L-lactate dehydrogenase complex protein LldG